MILNGWYVSSGFKLEAQSPCRLKCQSVVLQLANCFNSCRSDVSRANPDRPARPGVWPWGSPFTLTPRHPHLRKGTVTTPAPQGRCDGKTSD